MRELLRSFLVVVSVAVVALCVTLGMGVANDKAKCNSKAATESKKMDGTAKQYSGILSLTHPVR